MLANWACVEMLPAESTQLENPMRYTSRIGFAIAVILLFAIPAHTQTAPPKPGPEVQKLGYFAGNWTLDGEVKPGPAGPGGKMIGSGKYSWLDGGFFLEGRDESHGGGMGDSSDLAVMGYNPDEKVYTYHAFENTGVVSIYTGTVEGDTWTWHSEDKMGGKVMKGRYTVKVLSPTSYTFKFETASDAGDWTTVMEGKATKSK